MKAAAVTEIKNRLSHYLRLVARGEVVTVLDRGNPVAQIVPIGRAEESLKKLAASGIVRLSRRAVPEDFWTRRLPKSRVSVVAALDEDRADRL